MLSPKEEHENIGGSSRSIKVDESNQQQQEPQLRQGTRSKRNGPAATRTLETKNSSDNIMTSPSDDLLDDDQICNLSSVSCENENENENDDDDGEEDTRGILKPASGRPLNRRIASGYESHSSDIESAMEEGAPRSNSNSNSHKFVSFQGDMESVESSSRETAARDTTNTTAGTGMSAASRPSRRALLQNTKKQSSRVLLSPQGRFSQTIDLETGKVGGGRAQCAVIRAAKERHPQCRRRRGIKEIQRIVSPFWSFRRNNQQDDADDKNKNKRKRGNRRSLTIRSAHIPISDETQYRLVSIEATKSSGGGRFGGIGPGIYEETNSQFTNSGWLWLQPNRFVIAYLFWAFRSSFMAVLLSAAVWFSSVTMIFAILIYFIGMRNPDCVHVNGVAFDSPGGANFMDAYALSWTTFSTVGYGLVYPGTSATSIDVKNCTGITILSTYESFVGILFASFWGAIFLSKVTRVSSFAQVTFSDPILIRFGEGVGPADDDDEEEEEDNDHGIDSDDQGLESSDDGQSREDEISMTELTPLPSSVQLPKKRRIKLSKLQCPVLEFRVLNRLEGQRHGEIIDATMNIVASIDERQAASNQQGPKTMKRRGGKKGKGKRKIRRGVKRTYDEEDDVDEKELLTARRKVMAAMSAGYDTAPSQEEITDDGMNGVGSNKTFAKVEIESQEHPFFKRMWVARHVLDQDSPLLIPEAKDLVRLHNGHWPEELNTADAVRACVRFDQVLASLSGTSNADCNSVYAQKIYDYVDLCVGYRFCNVLYRDSEGCLAADPKLLNDVTEQIGGGGENLHARAMRYNSVIHIL